MLTLLFQTKPNRPASQPQPIFAKSPDAGPVCDLLRLDPQPNLRRIVEEIRDIEDTPLPAMTSVGRGSICWEPRFLGEG